MKHIAILFSLLMITACSGTTGSSDLSATCDTGGVSLKHVSGSASTRGSEYHIAISIDDIAMEAIADTGSSNLIVSNSSGLTPSGSGTPVPGNPGCPNSASICYGGGTYATLVAYPGTVDLNCGPGVSNFDYGYIQSGTANITLIGLAYRGAETGSVAKTFFEQLSEKTGLSDEFSMLLCGVNNPNSKITFGGTGNTPISSFQYVPITQKSYYVINAGAVKIGGVQMGTSTLSAKTTIVDSGTTLNLVPQDIYNAIVQKIGVSVGNPGDNITCPNTSGMPNVTIDLDKSVTLTIKPNTYFKKLDNGLCFFGFAPTNLPLNILGQVAMENYKVHFDRKFNNKQGQIGFAPNTECGN